jgi:hypothetical protein
MNQPQQQFAQPSVPKGPAPMLPLSPEDLRHIGGGPFGSPTL